MKELPDYTISSGVSGSYIEQLGQFEVILEEANKKGLVNSVPKNEAETYDIEKQRVRLQTIATRLYLLGYLRWKISPKRIHKRLEKIKKAVLKFQKDANLLQDNWVGDKTWYALDELVSFESDLRNEHWFVDGKIRPEVVRAVHRATQLRLWSLGLYRKRPRLKSGLLNKKSLYKFGRIAKIFLIEKEDFVADLNYDTLSILFDQDCLTYAITKHSKSDKDSFFVKLPEDNKAAETRLAQAFIINCAKIELWLLGYEVDIDGNTDYQYQEGSDLWRAMSAYFQQFDGMKRKAAEKLAMQITPTFFLKIGSVIEDTTNNFDSEEASEEIVNIVYSSNAAEATNYITEAWTYIKDKGVRLWDGLKRVWKWIKKIGKKAVRFIKRNVFAAFYRFTSKTYKIFKKGLSAVVKSLGVYFKGTLESPDVMFRFSKDMDINIQLSKSISLENANLGILKLQKQSKAFKLGCKIIGFLFYAFKNLTLGLLGWAKLLFSLLKGYKDLRLFYLELKMVGDFEA